MVTSEQLNSMSRYVEWLYQYSQLPLSQCKLMFVARFPGHGPIFDQLLADWLD